jgi:hypothetical protein
MHLGLDPSVDPPVGTGLLSALASDPFRVGHHRPEHPRSPRTAPNLYAREGPTTCRALDDRPHDHRETVLGRRRYAYASARLSRVSKLAGVTAAGRTKALGGRNEAEADGGAETEIRQGRRQRQGGGKARRRRDEGKRWQQLTL